MRLNDADGQSRLVGALSLLNGSLLSTLSKNFTPELYGVGDRLEPAVLEQLRPDARKSDLKGALTAAFALSGTARGRYRPAHRRRRHRDSLDAASEMEAEGHRAGRRVCHRFRVA